MYNLSKSPSPGNNFAIATPIRCELLGADKAQAGDLIARGASPVFNLCRLLMAAGVDPAAPLQCYRNGTLALTVKSVGVGAGLTIRETDTGGPRIVRWKAFPHRAVAPLVRLNSKGLSGPQREGLAP